MVGELQLAVYEENGRFPNGESITKDDRAFLRGIIAQFDAVAAIEGDDADSRALRAEGRYRVGTMHYRLGEFRESLENSDQALSINKQLAADFPSRPEFRHTAANWRNCDARGEIWRTRGGPTRARLPNSPTRLPARPPDFSNCR